MTTYLVRIRTVTEHEIFIETDKEISEGTDITTLCEENRCRLYNPDYYGKEVKRQQEIIEVTKEELVILGGK